MPCAARVIVPTSRTSQAMSSTSLMRSARRSALPRRSLSTTRTLCPSRTSRRTTAEPMKPVPPVTRIDLPVMGSGRFPFAAEREVADARRQPLDLAVMHVPIIVDDAGRGHLRGHGGHFRALEQGMVVGDHDDAGARAGLVERG